TQPTSGLPAIDPDLTAFVDDFDAPSSDQELSGIDFVAEIADGAMHLSVLTPGVSDEIPYPAQAPGDFTFTIEVGEVAGQGEILASVRESADNAAWRFAVNPAAQTWRLDRESPFGHGYYAWVTPRAYGARMPDSLHSITIARQRDALSFLLNGVDVVNPVNTPLPRVSGPVTVAFGAGTPPESGGEAFSAAIERVSLSDHA
ncbi:MAG: hypothetical protein KC442_21275, partial [Thermomicrobiales bacterium]|nr:hypothetical protein [Thermomicrobiales bacterium]